MREVAQVEWECAGGPGARLGLGCPSSEEGEYPGYGLLKGWPTKVNPRATRSQRGRGWWG